MRAYAGPERRNWLTRPFSTMNEKDAQYLRDAWARMNEERVAREEKPLTRQGLADTMGLTLGRVSHFFNGNAKYAWDDRWQIADFMDLTPWDVWPELPYRERALQLAGLSRKARQLLQLFEQLSDEGQNSLIQTARIFPRRTGNTPATVPVGERAVAELLQGKPGKPKRKG